MFGSHLSIAGGTHKALFAAERLGMDTVQIFTSNPRQLALPFPSDCSSSADRRPRRAGALPHGEAEVFRGQVRRLGFAEVVAHDSYLINLAAPAGALRERSLAAFAREVDRCAALGVTRLVFHPGCHTTLSAQEGMKNIVAGLNAIAARHTDAAVTLCLETTAGQGSSLGHRFEQIAELLAGLTPADRFGVCVDTAHIHAAGYDITSARAVRATFAELDRVVGLARVRVLHVNDSKTPRGSRVDRHEHIGLGYIGLAAFRFLCTDERFAAVPKILETPKEKGPCGAKNGPDEAGFYDTLNLRTLRALGRGKRVAEWWVGAKGGPAHAA